MGDLEKAKVPVSRYSLAPSSAFPEEWGLALPVPMLGSSLPERATSDQSLTHTDVRFPRHGWAQETLEQRIRTILLSRRLSSGGFTFLIVVEVLGKAEKASVCSTLFPMVCQCLPFS